MTMIRERSKWLMRYHPEVAGEIRAMWKQMWRNDAPRRPH